MVIWGAACHSVDNVRVGTIFTCPRGDSWKCVTVFELQESSEKSRSASQIQARRGGQGSSRCAGRDSAAGNTE